MANPDVFVLKWEFDASEHYFFQGAPGQTEQDFNIACTQFVDEATTNAINNSVEDSYVGWNDIVKELAALLPRSGFYEFKPATVTFEGPAVISADEEMLGGILSPASRTAVLAFNNSIDAKYMPVMQNELGDVYEVQEQDDES